MCKQLLSEGRVGYLAQYTYDGNGNRLTKTLNGVTENYSYDPGDKLLTAGSKTFQYDAAGRTTSISTPLGTEQLTYDYENRIIGISYSGGASNSFTYNGLDARVGKVDSKGTFAFKRDGAEVTDAVLSDGAANYTPEISE